MIRVLSTLQAVVFEEGGAISAMGLDTPDAYTVTVVLSDGSTRTLVVGATPDDDEGLRFARVDAGLTFTLRSYTAADVMQTAADLITSNAPTGVLPAPQVPPLDFHATP